MSASMRAARPITGRFVLLAMLAFFGVVTAVNGVFIALALSSFSGLSVEGAYQRGLDFNRELATAAAQKARGWRVSLQAKPLPQGVALSVRMADAAGAPLTGEVQAELIRPTAKGHDFALTLSQAEAGRYVGVAPLALRGQWIVRVVARSGGEAHVLEERLCLP